MTEREMDLSTTRVERHLFGILCTYRRPDDALTYLDRLDTQTLTPSVVVIVDNGSDAVLRAAIASRHSDRTEYRYVDVGANLGPAGAFRRGFDELRSLASPDDFIAHLDDDDPPVSDTQLEQLVADLAAELESDLAIGGIGLSGGNLSPRTGFISRTSPSKRLGEVDHLHGGYLPVYTVSALADVQSHDPSFFFGFEELELGRRMHQRGWRLLVDNELMDKLESQYPKKRPKPTLWRQSHAAYSDGDWSRFHKERNLIRILRREGLWIAIVVTVVSRHVLKPASGVFKNPSRARNRIVLGLRATRAGLQGRTGIDERYPPPSGQQ